jgi:uncharacterized membrane protein
MQVGVRPVPANKGIEEVPRPEVLGERRSVKPGREDFQKRLRKRLGDAGALARPTGPQESLEALSEVEGKIIRDRTISERIAGFATKHAGSMTFVVFHVMWFGAWILVNLGFVEGLAPFDPFPFGFLTFMVSLEAIFLALLVLIAQNRMAKEADKRALLDLEINTLAEQESTKTLEMLQAICGHLSLPIDGEEEATELAQKTDVQALAEELDEKLPHSQ